MPTLMALSVLRQRLGAIERALLQGFTAGENDQAMEMNPYPPGTIENRAWFDAWTMGVEYNTQATEEPEPL